MTDDELLARLEAALKEAGDHIWTLHYPSPLDAAWIEDDYVYLSGKHRKVADYLTGDDAKLIVEVRNALPRLLELAKDGLTCNDKLYNAQLETTRQDYDWQTKRNNELHNMRLEMARRDADWQAKLDKATKDMSSPSAVSNESGDEDDE